MRKVALVWAILIFSTTTVFAAWDRAGQTDLGFQIGALMPTGDKIDTAAQFGGTVSFGVNEWFAVGLELGYADSSTDFTVNGIDSEANIKRIPLFFDMIARYNDLE